MNLYGSATDTKTAQSVFITTSFQFKRSGLVTVPVMVVPNTGPYKGITPNPPDLFQRPTGDKGRPHPLGECPCRGVAVRSEPERPGASPVLSPAADYATNL